MPEDQRPGAVVVVILTDGHENHSREFNRQQIFDMITKQQREYQWEFIFLAANQDAIDVGASYGIVNAANYSANAGGMAGIASNLSKGIGSYRGTRCSNDLRVNDAVVEEPSGSLVGKGPR
jgi:hypothetical protein